jgi:hypothetical protein
VTREIRVRRLNPSMNYIVCRAMGGVSHRDGIARFSKIIFRPRAASDPRSAGNGRVSGQGVHIRLHLRRVDSCELRADVNLVDPTRTVRAGESCPRCISVRTWRPLRFVRPRTLIVKIEFGKGWCPCRDAESPQRVQFPDCSPRLVERSKSPVGVGER